MNLLKNGAVSLAAIAALCAAGCGGSVSVDGTSPQEARAGGEKLAGESGAVTVNGVVVNGDSPASSKDSQPATTSCNINNVERIPARRLSHAEYNRTALALFPGVTLPEQHFAPDLKVHGLENNANATNASPVLIEQYADAAAKIAEAAVGKLDQLRIVPCKIDSLDMNCARQFIASFGLNAFRRPLTDAEQGRYEAFFNTQMKSISARAAVELTLQAFLQSPQFLYRLELGAKGERSDQLVAVDDYGMATRLSYFIWQRMPDADLLDAAKGGRLHDKGQIEAQVRRMLKSNEAAEAFVDFHRQWLDFDRLLGENKEAEMFPTWSDALRSSMREESNRFVKHVFGEGSASIAELLTSNVSFVNKPLAALYGVTAPSTDFGQVTLPKERAGILTRGTFLASRAHSTNGSPPLRGVAVLDELLCARPPAPPASLNTSVPAATSEMDMTNRQLFESRTGRTECNSCHQTINGIGYGFEAFDAIGSYRLKDHGKPVDASGAVMGTSDIDGSYQGAVELSEKLAGSRQVEQCAARNVFRYALGREDLGSDACKLDELFAALDRGGGDLRELVVAIATSHEFTHRPGVSVE